MRIHFAGGGKTAEYVVHRLMREDHTLVIMDRDESRVQALSETVDATVLVGNVTNIEDCRAAGLALADIFVACTDSDETNVLACLIADDLAPNAIKAILLTTSEFNEWGRMLDNLKVRVDRIIHSEADVVARILRVIHVPGIADIRDFCGGKVKVFAMHIKGNNPLAGLTNAEVKKHSGLDMQVCAIFRGAQAIIPSAKEEIHPGDNVYIITSEIALNEALKFVGIKQRPDTHKVFIVGGEEIALELARELQKQKVSIKLFDTNRERCEKLASQLEHTTVLNTDGTDQDNLIQEGIHEVDAFISLTPVDNHNLIASLLARRLGVDKVIPLINKISNQHLAQKLGISTTVSPRVKTADALLEYIRGGGVLSVRTLGEEEAEAIEIQVEHDSRCCALPVCALPLPKNAMVGAIVSEGNKNIVPEKDQIIRPGDHIIFFANERAIPSIESKILGRSRRK